MARIAFLLLVHDDPAGIIAQATRLAAAGDAVAVHVDARMPRADFAAVAAGLAEVPGVALVRGRVKGGWGDWSLVAATLASARLALDAFPDATHLYLLSGDCLPIKPAARLHAALDAVPCDRIEAVDFHASGWIRTGLRAERLVYRHYFNERRQRRLFYAALGVQQRLGLARRTPEGIVPMVGSQWWCLRRTTVEAVLGFMAARPDVGRFFRRTWIPDETFFQTLVRHLVPGREIASAPPTFLMFSDYGMPVVFHDDHHDLLLGQPQWFARKVSRDARALRARLGDLWTGPDHVLPAGSDGRRLHAFLTRAGREGRRFGPRAWEEGAGPRSGQALLLVTCKKWHVGLRVLARLEVPGVGYLFDDAATPLPQMGGIETGIDKLSRHRRALVRLLFEALGTDRLALCLDPARLDILRDLASSRAGVRVLELVPRYTPRDLDDHALRLGLVSDEGVSDHETLRRVLAREIAAESDRLGAAGLPGHTRVVETDPPEAQATALGHVLGSEAAARAVLASGDLFAD